ncbi:MAG: polyprenyl synthetase family protein [Chloroflexi bacterium]|nr:polyprenyl synthetase family protein [Chloroflexota bacterium]
MSIQQIFAPIQNELQQIEARLRETVRVEYIPLANIFEMLIGSGGKRIRPGLCVLATRFHPTDPEQAITLAISTELVHAATLIHDDLIDKSSVRRGSPTVNSRWSGTATVLAGDFLLARAADIAASIENFRVMRIFARTLMTICEGEIRQDFARAHWPPNREEYYRHIESKTASLFVAATEGGAILSGAPENEIAALKEYGRTLGMAFQMVDDILDFTADENELGKPVGSDLRQGTFTLPIFYYLEQDARAKTLGDFTGADIERLIDAIRNSPAIAAAKAEAQRTAHAARDALAIFPDTVYRRALIELADYVVERTL